MALYRIVTHGVFASLILCAALFNTAQAMSDTNGTSGAAESCNPPLFLTQSWPNTDFSNCTIDLAEIISGGPPKDGIPPIDNPRFLPLDEVQLQAREPVISLVVEGQAKAYPLSILTWHEIVNDEIASVPVAVTYCP